jgi:DNA-binding response OmpR family regulator
MKAGFSCAGNSLGFPILNSNTFTNPQHSKIVSQETNATTGRKLRIILLEEDDTLRRLFADMIRAWRPEAELLTFSDGFEVARTLVQFAPDLLITDEYHDGLHGSVIVEHLARRQVSCSVLWTAGDGVYDLTAVFGHLRHEVLPKPFVKEQFLEKLDALMAPPHD